MTSYIPRSPEGEDYTLYQALYAYKSNDPDDLSFDVDEILQVTDEGMRCDWDHERQICAAYTHDIYIYKQAHTCIHAYIHITTRTNKHPAASTQSTNKHNRQNIAPEGSLNWIEQTP